jgi:hypothetical protein
MTRQLMYGQRHRGKLDRGFEELQSIMSGSGTSKATSHPIQTKTDSMFESTKHLLMTASRLESAAKVLGECFKIFGDNQSSRSLISKRSQHLKRYIVPLIWYAADSLNDISKKLAPIGSVKYVHKRTEDKRKFKVVAESNTRMSPDLQLVCNFINSKGDIHKVTPPKKKLRTTTSCMPSEVTHSINDDIKLPLPVNGHEYRKPEVVNILSLYKKGSKSIGLAMKKKSS